MMRGFLQHAYQQQQHPHLVVTTARRLFGSRVVWSALAASSPDLWFVHPAAKPKTTTTTTTTKAIKSSNCNENRSSPIRETVVASPVRLQQLHRELPRRPDYQLQSARQAMTTTTGMLRLPSSSPWYPPCPSSLLLSSPVSSSSSSPWLAQQKRQHHGNLRRSFSSSAAAYDDHDATDDNTSTSATSFPFLLADIGEGIKEVELLQWFVQVGDTVAQFDKVCEVQSDKATVEITSRFDGTVSQLCGAVGHMMQVGQPLLFLQTDQHLPPNEAVKASTMAPPATTTTAAKLDTTLEQEQMAEHEKDDNRLHIPTIASHFELEIDHLDDTVTTSTAASNSNKYEASPAVRKLGQEYKLDLKTLQGSGPHGRLLKSDVITFLKEQGKWKAGATAEVHEDDHYHQDQATPAVQVKQPQKPQQQSDDDEIVQLKGYSRLMVKSMTASLQIPHMCFSDEMIVNKLMEARAKINIQWQQQQQLNNIDESTEHKPSKLSMLVFFIKACSLALDEYPMINAVVHDEESCQLRLIRNRHDIGIAVDTPRGLVVPVIRNVQHKSLFDIQLDLDILKQKAQANKLTMDDLSDPPPTFTLSNIGAMGGTYMQPVIQQPQLAMGALGQIQRLPRFTKNTSMEVYEAHVMNVSWSGDHRWLDGALLARFNASFKQYVEDPLVMLGKLK